MSKAGASFIHHMPTGLKLAILFGVSIAIFFVPNLTAMSAVVLIIFALYPLAGFRLLQPFVVLKPLFWFLLAILVFQLFVVAWPQACLVILRLIALYWLASLITLTTSTTAMLETFDRIFEPLRFIGVKPQKLSLALSLTLRFIPVFQAITQEVREAQKARGLEKSIFATLLPVATRMLKMSDDVAKAIEARCYDTQDTK